MKEKSNKKIIFAAQDPGGFNSLFGVIQKLQSDDSFRIKTLLANESRKMAEKRGVEYVDCTDVSSEDINDILDEFRPDIIFSATSDGSSVEKKIIQWGKKNNVKTIAIVDFWSNYKLRFSSPGTEDMEFGPNMICVIDEFMKKEMVGEGFEEEKLVITGNPFFDTFEKTESKRGDYILFTSQPFSEAYQGSGKKIDVPIFNEIDVFSQIVEQLEELKIDLPIKIALHPRSKKKDKYDNILNSSSLKIEVAQENTENLIEKSELVIGINTMVLFQAAITGNKVISYQPGITQDQDPLVSNHLKISHSAYNKEVLKSLLKNIFSKEEEIKQDDIADNYLNKNFTDKVINVIRNCLK